MSKEEIIKKASERLELTRNTSIYEELLKDNIISFKVKDKKYRVRRLTLFEKQELLQKKAEKFGELINKPNWKFREQITEEVKKKGFDIDKIDKEVVRLQVEIDNLLETLAKISEETKIQTLKNQINTLSYKQAQISQQKTNLFQFSIEDYLEFYVKSYFGYLVTEIENEDKWIKAFKSYEEFLNSNEFEVIKYIATYIDYLIRVGELG